MKLVIAEKPSVAQSIARVLGAAGRKDGYLEGPCRSSGPALRADRSGAETGYLVSWCVGHLVELSAPETYDERYSKWRLEDLPILPESWLYQVSSGTKKQFGILKELMKRPDVESLVCATDAGYESKTGKNISIRGKNQKRFVRLSSLSEGYREADLRQYFLNPTVRKTQSRPVQRKERISLLIDVQEKLQTKGPGYARWAKVHNLKEMSKSLLFLREHGIDSREELHALVDKKVAERDALLGAVQSMEKRITEIAALWKHIYNYSDTRATYEAYRKAGYSKKFFEAHREELTIHKAAKKAFDELGVKKIPRVRELNVEYAELMKEKKAKFREYRSACSEAREYLAIRENIASLYDAERKENADRKKRKENER